MALLPLAAFSAPRLPHLRLGLLLLMLALSLTLALGAWAPPAPPLMTPGFVQADLDRQPVEHGAGGVVREVLVRNGQRVAAGQPLLWLADAGSAGSAPQLVTAPVAGEVHSLRATLPGAEVGPGEPLAMIVPDSPTLLVETRLPATHVARVQEGQAATIRFGGADHPLLPGRVVYLSPDRLAEGGAPGGYYTTLVAVEPQALAEAGGARLLAGMRAEVVIAGEPGPLLQRLTAPLAAWWLRLLAGD